MFVLTWFKFDLCFQLNFKGNNKLPCFCFQPIQAAELIDSEFRPGMSNRQKNKAKRMAKLVAKQRSRDVDPNEKR